MVTHQGNRRPFSCTICPSKFSQLDSLKRHQRSAHDPSCVFLSSSSIITILTDQSKNVHVVYAVLFSPIETVVNDTNNVVHKRHYGNANRQVTMSVSITTTTLHIQTARAMRKKHTKSEHGSIVASSPSHTLPPQPTLRRTQSQQPGLGLPRSHYGYDTFLCKSAFNSCHRLNDGNRS